jgi:ubiquinone/menaquinone biosynthesis C-methylase UbiE
MKEDHHEVIRREFSKQAPRFEGKGLALANPEHLHWVVDNLDLRSHFEVLDVAAGTGHLSRAIAPYVRRVVALDLTPEMLVHARREAEDAGLTNIVFERGFAESLPYPDESFDLVVSRLSIHHFEDPHIQIGEMARVCRPGGKVAVSDLVSPDDTGLAATHNRLERVRDPSHTRALSAGELTMVARNAGLEILRTVSREVEVSVDRWLELTGVANDGRRRIIAEFTQELNGLSMTGMRPFIRDNELMLVQTWVIAVGVKPSRARDKPDTPGRKA